MPVIDLELYRMHKAIRDVEKQMAELILAPGTNGAAKIKTCFREFVTLLEKTGTK